MIYVEPSNPTRTQTFKATHDTKKAREHETGLRRRSSEVLWDSHCLFGSALRASAACQPLATRHVPRICFNTIHWQRARFVTKIPVALFGTTCAAQFVTRDAAPHRHFRLVRCTEPSRNEVRSRERSAFSFDFSWTVKRVERKKCWAFKKRKRFFLLLELQDKSL